MFVSTELHTVELARHRTDLNNNHQLIFIIPRYPQPFYLNKLNQSNKGRKFNQATKMSVSAVTFERYHDIHENHLSFRILRTSPPSFPDSY